MNPVVTAPTVFKTSWKKLWEAVSALIANAGKKLNNNTHGLFRRLKSGHEEYSCLDYSTLVPAQGF